MAELIVSFFIFAGIWIEFLIFGTVAKRILRLNLKSYETIIAGFFLYFGFFQIVALPLILLQYPFHILFYLWIGICVIINVYVIIFARNSLLNEAFIITGWLGQQKRYLIIGVLLCIGFTCYFHAVQPYMGWDTSYYVGTVNTTVYTDTMYVYNGNSGVKEQINFRYALSAFYIHSAFLCKLGNVSALIMQKYVVGALCICMHGLIIFAIGKKIFRGNSVRALQFLIAEIVLNYGFCTIYTTSSFLLIRGYEAKGFCANVIIPAIFYITLCLWNDVRKREKWVILFLISFASVPVSMSSILIVPAMLAIVLATELIIKRDLHIIWKGILCVIPNGIYLIVYYLYTQGFRIPLK